MSLSQTLGLRLCVFRCLYSHFRLPNSSNLTKHVESPKLCVQPLVLPLENENRIAVQQKGACVLVDCLCVLCEIVDIVALLGFTTSQVPDSLCIWEKDVSSAFLRGFSLSQSLMNRKSLASTQKVFDAFETCQIHRNCSGLFCTR